MNASVESAPTETTTPDRPTSGDPGHRGLFAALSRELCRPLISLHAGFDLLLAGCEGPIADAQRDQVLALRSQCISLIALTRSFLDYAGSGRARRPLDPATFRLGALLAEADRQFSVAARARGIDWSCRLDGGDATVVTDLACFQQVVGQLVANAMAHTPDGGRIDVTARADADGWSVEVADDGRGIPSQALERVFEPLIRLGSAAGAATGGGPGHGMGLPVCRDLVARLGGRIVLRSAPGRGTTVLLRFGDEPEPGRRPA